MLPDALQSVAQLAEGFDPTPYPTDVQGWGSDSPVFAELIASVRPKLIVEVGTWKGASALHMARCCDELGLETRIICIDTWLGAYEFIGGSGERDLLRMYGYPHVYYQFLANVIRAGQQERIYPFPQTSVIAGRYLYHHGVRADLIYLDGSHDLADVAHDIASFYPLVRRGGVLFGDDYDCWPSVRKAVETCGRSFTVHGDRYWVLQ